MTTNKPETAAQVNIRMALNIWERRRKGENVSEDEILFSESQINAIKADKLRGVNTPLFDRPINHFIRTGRELIVNYKK